jgi:uncharacterized protein YlxW (UPF0749 family)
MEDAGEKKRKEKKRKEKKIKKVLTSVYLLEETHLRARILGLRFEHLIELGLQSYENQPQLLSRVQELDKDNVLIKDRLRTLTERFYSLSSQVEELKKKLVK